MFSIVLFFFFNDTATTEIYTLSLHDALPILPEARGALRPAGGNGHGLLLRPCLRDAPGHGLAPAAHRHPHARADRKSTRLNSSHANISYAVFCLKKKKKCSILRDARHMYNSK